MTTLHYVQVQCHTQCSSSRPEVPSGALTPNTHSGSGQTWWSSLCYADSSCRKWILLLMESLPACALLKLPIVYSRATWCLPSETLEEQTHTEHVREQSVLSGGGPLLLVHPASKASNPAPVGHSPQQRLQGIWSPVLLCPWAAFPQLTPIS